MTETKADTALKVSDVQRLESELAKARETAKNSILAIIGEHITELATLGFYYTLEEQKKIGRPKKGAENGLV